MEGGLKAQRNQAQKTSLGHLLKIGPLDPKLKLGPSLGPGGQI